MGHIKHSFILAFYFLLQSSKTKDILNFFYKAIGQTVKLAGDTDSNACIVGGLLGAALGISKIPQDMLEQLLDNESMH